MDYTNAINVVISGGVLVPLAMSDRIVSSVPGWGGRRMSNRFEWRCTNGGGRRRVGIMVEKWRLLPLSYVPIVFQRDININVPPVPLGRVGIEKYRRVR